MKIILKLALATRIFFPKHETNVNKINFHQTFYDNFRIFFNLVRFKVQLFAKKNNNKKKETCEMRIRL